VGDEARQAKVGANEVNRFGESSTGRRKREGSHYGNGAEAGKEGRNKDGGTGEGNFFHGKDKNDSQVTKTGQNQ